MSLTLDDKVAKGLDDDDDDDDDEMDNEIQKVTAPPPAVHGSSFMAGRAKAMARRPWLHFLTALIISLVLSVVGLIVGDFSVTADNNGWQSRGTLIADRHAQVLLTVVNRWDLLSGRASVWDNLITNVQPGWQSSGEAPADVRRLEAASTPITTDSLSEKPNRQLPFAMTDEFKRRLQTISVQGTRCDVSIYMSPDRLLYDSTLFPVWETRDKSMSAMDPTAIKDICIAEQKTMAVLEAENLCTGCQDGRCMPPYSPVLFARIAVGDSTASLSCEELAQLWSENVADFLPDMKLCVDGIKSTLSYDNLAEDGNCPPLFSPTMIDENFGVDNNDKTRYTSSIFITNGDVERMYEIVDKFDRGSGSILGAYDTQYEEFVETYVDTAVQQDMILAMGSAAITATAILLHTRSPWITLIGLGQIILSFPLAFFVYTFIGQLEFFPFLNFIGVFVVFALGADDIFVAIDKWKNARLENKNGTTEEIAAVALPDAAGAMFLTTITTAVAFFATAICPVAPLKMFAIFNGLLIMFDYIMCVVLVFPALCLYDGWRMNGCCLGCCVSLHVCKKTEEFEDEDEESKPSLIRRILNEFYKVLHLLRWPLLAACVAGLVLSAIFATRLELPQSSDVRLLSNSHQFEANYQWRQELLYDVIDRSSGSAAVVIWGVKPADTGNHNNPESFTQMVPDYTFDPTSIEAQNYLLGFCEPFFQQDFADFTEDGYVCPINQFDTWVRSQANRTVQSQSPAYRNNCDGASSVPMNPDTFSKCIIAWSQSAFGDTTVLSREGVLRIMYFRFQTKVRFDSPYDELNTEWNKIEDYLENERKSAPASLNKMYHSSTDFWWFDTNGRMLQTAYGAAAIALGAAGIVVLLSSRSFVLTIFSIFTIGYVLTSTTAMLVASGWTLGFLESVCFAILIGVSCDFVIHFGHAYKTLPGDVDRHTRTKYALIQMGPSILAAAFTTICSAAIMLGTVISFFQRFAVILFFTIIQATLGSFIVYLTLSDAIGPAHPTYLFDKFDAYIRKLRNKEPADGSEVGEYSRGSKDLGDSEDAEIKSFNINA